DVRQWNETFAGGTHLVLSPIDTNNVQSDEFIDRNDIAVFKKWLSDKGIMPNRYLIKPLPGRKVLIQLPGEKYVTSTKERVENAGLNWQEFSQKALKEGSAIKITENKIALKTKPIIRVPDAVDQEFVDLVKVFEYVPIKELISFPVLELKLAKPLSQSQTSVTSEFPVADLKEFDGKKYLLFQTLDIGSYDIEEVSSSVSEYGDFVVRIQLNKFGAKKFAALTKAYIGEELAIIYNDDILAVPMVRERIVDGRIDLSGNFQKEELEDIALKLRVSSLLAKYRIYQADVLTKELWVGKK
ncbi:MAG: hypothetical protein PHV17_09120, partial [Candidatus Omnitrophica bacterium]|nr:hypothetical protein [Candidatus Omnitrophota bacterium]